MSLAEDSYGRAKRLDFVRQAVAAGKAARLLDVGCGNGSQLTAPLAALCPEIEIVGVDSDIRSIDWARDNLAGPRLCFTTPEEMAEDDRFDVVIASEVLEHVEQPGEFLLMLRKRLAEDGCLVVTVPNGYGPFEVMALTEALLTLSGLQKWLSRLKRRLLGAPPADKVTTDTLAVSPHVNFFSKPELERLFAAAGFAVARFRPRTVFCGYLIDGLFSRPAMAARNARLADCLPACCASDWMFELRPVAAPGPVAWRRGAWARFRKRLNEKRWGLA